MLKPLDLPYSMKMIFKRVVTGPLGTDPRTDWAKGIVLGNTHEVNRRDILQFGLADFKNGYQANATLASCSDKVLLYCHYYLKYTFFACKRAFSDPSMAAFHDVEHPVCLLDIGCGPGTAALAFSANAVGGRLFYVGIDESTAMLDAAPRIFAEGQAKGLISRHSQLVLERRWQDLDPGVVPKDAHVLIVFSFFLGSTSLGVKDIKDLADWIHSVAEIATHQPVICFVNSPHSSAMERFEYLKKCLPNWRTLVPLTPTDVHYYNHQRSIGGQSIVYELGFPG